MNACGHLIARLLITHLFAGQIELYSHLPVMKQLCDALKDWGFSICGVYLVRISDAP